MVGERLDFSAMAETLKRLAVTDARDFYEGELARSIAGGVERLGGSMRLGDLQDCHARDPGVGATNLQS